MFKEINLQMGEKMTNSWYLGLDIGTNSVGYAVTDPHYQLKKAKGNAMWGVHLFDDAKTAAERRKFRNDRRRRDRKKQRICLLQELFAKEIAKVDIDFFDRIRESALYKEDKSYGDFSFFNDENFTDKEYNEQYKTIHDLINELENSTSPHDVRLVYLACAYHMAHRGHFLLPVDKDGVNQVYDFSLLYDNFIKWFDGKEAWECDADEFKKVLLENRGVKAKEKAFIDLLFGGKKPAKPDAEGELSLPKLISFISGGKVKLSQLFGKASYQEIDGESITVLAADFSDKLDTFVSQLDDGDAELLNHVKQINDWVLLNDILGEEKSIAKAKVNIYEQHKKDLKFLKYIVNKYIPHEYDNVFRIAVKPAKKGINNYCAYSYNINDLKSKGIKIPDSFEKVNIEGFCAYLKKLMENVKPYDEDKEKFDDMMARIGDNSFCPKQVSVDNRVIPYQLTYHSLKIILENASNYLDFLNDKDEYGTVKDKILSIMTYRIPYYVGPLMKRKDSDVAWIVRKAEGKILPWNFDELVNHEESERAFINRMIGSCTYLPGEKVLPKNSLLYTKFTVLNEINNLKINDKPISVQCKQKIYDQLFLKEKKVTRKMIENLLLIEGIAQKEDSITGIDITVKSSLKPYLSFKNLLNNGDLTEVDVEKIILQISCTEENKRVQSWLKNTYPELSDNDIKYIASLKFKDFGRLSEKFLTGIYDVDEKTGETSGKNIITMLWETNYNLMQLLSNDFTYSKQLDTYSREYFQENPMTLAEKLDNLYISGSAKRSIIRTLDVVNDIKSLMKTEPRKIFIEMARGGGEKGKRTISRKARIEEFYKNIKDDTTHLQALLSDKTEEQLRSDRLYLYFTQLGKCMYSGEPIEIEFLGKSNRYDIDHIYPRTLLKDDSLDNKALVCRELNDEKRDDVLNSSIRDKMFGFWTGLKEKEMISEKKYNRLIRSRRFSDEEKAEFINRQLVETRQSTLAVTKLIGDIFPNSEVVYVRSNIISEFRQKFELLKCREVNDFHHAKDAYLNIVLGNAYDVKFTKSPMNFIKSGEKYSMKIESLLKHNIERNGVVAWEKDKTIAVVKAVMTKNNIRYVRYCYCRKQGQTGGLFNQQPQKATLHTGATSDLVERKAGLSVVKYGGYNNTTASAFALIKYQTQKTEGILIFPVELMYLPQYVNDKAFAHDYALNMAKKLVALKKDDGIAQIAFPLGNRMLKINTILEVDGLRLALSKKSSKGKQLGFALAVSLLVDQKTQDYIKNITQYLKKSDNGIKYSPSETYDKITTKQNESLYDLLTEKCIIRPYVSMFSNHYNTLINGKEKFMGLLIEKQCVALANIMKLFKSGRLEGCDLTLIGGAANAGEIKLNSNFTKAKINNISIIDQSPSGLYEKRLRLSDL